MELRTSEAIQYIWQGAIPLQIQLHESEVATLPSPPPLLILGPRIGYLPLLIPLIKPHFSSALPPGADTVWFDYNGLPLKWYMPIGVLFDLLCAEPERPWNLTVHFRAYPGEVLTPCEGEDSVKWSYINSLKEAAYIINGNCKNIMNMSQADQFDLWQSVVKGNMDNFLRISARLKLDPVGGDHIVKKAHRHAADEPEFVGPNRSSRIPVRLYVRNVDENFDDLEAAPLVDSWDRISYINRSVEIHKDGDDAASSMTLKQAVSALLPEIFDVEPSIDSIRIEDEGYHEVTSSGETEALDAKAAKTLCRTPPPEKTVLIRIQGIEPDMDIPFLWVANNLKNPEYFLHISVFVRTASPQES